MYFLQKSVYELETRLTSALQSELASKRVSAKEVFPVVLEPVDNMNATVILNVHLPVEALATSQTDSFASRSAQVEKLYFAARIACGSHEIQIVGDLNARVGLGNASDNVACSTSSVSFFKREGIRHCGNAGVDGAIFIEKTGAWKRKTERLLDPRTGNILGPYHEIESAELHKAKIQHPSYAEQWLADTFLRPYLHTNIESLHQEFQNAPEFKFITFEVNHFNAHRLHLCSFSPLFGYEQLIKEKTMPGLTSEQGADGLIHYYFVLEGPDAVPQNVYKTLPSADSMSYAEQYYCTKYYANQSAFKLSHHLGEEKACRAKADAANTGKEKIFNSCRLDDKTIKEDLKKRYLESKKEPSTEDAASSYAEALFSKETRMQEYLRSAPYLETAVTSQGKEKMEFCKTINYTPQEMREYTTCRTELITAQMNSNPEYKTKESEYSSALRQATAHREIAASLRVSNDSQNAQLTRLNTQLKEQFDIIHTECKSYNNHLLSAKKWDKIKLPKKAGSLAKKQTIATSMVISLSNLESNKNLCYADKLQYFSTEHAAELTKWHGSRDRVSAKIGKVILNALIVALGSIFTGFIAAPLIYEAVTPRMWKIQGKESATKIQASIDKALLPKPPSL